MRIPTPTSAGAPTRALSSEVDKKSTGFASTLADNVSHLAQLQAAADRAVESAATGDLSKLHEAVLAMQKASLALELAMTVRNHVVDGVKEILHTQT